MYCLQNSMQKFKQKAVGIYYLNSCSIYNKFSMERVRIRSMLNHLKSNQANISARKTIDSSLQNPVMELLTNVNEQNVSMSIKNNCYFINSNENTISRQDEEAQGQDRGYFSTPKQSTNKKRTKIANKSFMLTIPNKKRAHENLKQLGIKTKTINFRNLKSTQKIGRLQNGDLFFNFQNLTARNNNVIKYDRNLRTSSQRRSSVPDNHIINLSDLKQKNEMPKYPLLPWARTKSKNLNFTDYYKPEKVPMLLNIGRKNSDIRPWQHEVESP